MFGLLHRGELDGVVENEFEHMSTRLQHLWLVEHNEDGSHKLDLMGVALEEHTHDAVDIVSGELDVARIPDLPASQITSGAFAKARQHASTVYEDESNTFAAQQIVSSGGGGLVQLGNAFTDGGYLSLSGAEPIFDISETDRGVDLKRWRVVVAGESFELRAITDAFGALVTLYTINRSGNIAFTGTIKERARSIALGEWQTVTYAAGNYATANAETWTVAAGDVVSHQYTLIGKTMIVNFHFITTSVSGSTGYLSIPVPGGHTIARSARNIYHGNNAGAGYETGFVFAPAGSTILQFFRPGAANWTAAADNTLLAGQVTFEIQ